MFSCEHGTCDDLVCRSSVTPVSPNSLAFVLVALVILLFELFVNAGLQVFTTLGVARVGAKIVLYGLNFNPQIDGLVGLYCLIRRGG